MLRKRRKVPNQRRPKGHMWPTPPEWKIKVQELMREQGITRAELSRRIKVSDAAITGLFKLDATPTSRLVPAVNAAVGLPPPSMSPVDGSDAYRQQLDAIWSSLGEDDKKLLVDTAVNFSRKKK